MTQVSYEVRDCFFSYNKTLQWHIRSVPKDKRNSEMFMTWHGPEIGECDEILKTVLDLHFKNSKLGVHFKTNNLFNASGPTVSHIRKRKIKCNILLKHVFFFLVKGCYLYASPITIILCDQWIYNKGCFITVSFD